MHCPGSILLWPFPLPPCLSTSKLVQGLPSALYTKNCLPIFFLPSLPSSCPKVIRQGPSPLFSVSPPHASPGCPSLSPPSSLLSCNTASLLVSLPLTLLPHHTLHLYNPQILSSLLFIISGLRCTHSMVRLIH